MFSCLQILEAFLWFVLITLLNVTLIILTLSVSRLLNLLLRLVARSEERFSRNAETDLVCRLLLEKKKSLIQVKPRLSVSVVLDQCSALEWSNRYRLLLRCTAI